MPYAAAVAWKAPVHLTFSAGPNAALLTLPNVGLFTADVDYQIVSATERHETLGTNGSAVTADIVSAANGVAMASGVSMLASTFDLKATINTTQTRSAAAGTLSATNQILSAGSCIGIKFTGTFTALTGVCITVILVPLKQATW